MQRRHHYETAFEAFLRDRRIPYVAVDEARRAILPESAELAIRGAPGAPERTIKSFDFVLYSHPSNLLVEVKGRRIGRHRPALRLAADGRPMPHPPSRSKLESWVTQDDVDALTRWEVMFGAGFEAAIVFVYWCEEQPPDALFEEIWPHQGRWYAIRGVLVQDYRRAMVVRSPRWGTVHVPSGEFDRISRPLIVPGSAGPFASENPDATAPAMTPA